jgi:ABC-type multidrug transport system ATPase subunit
MGRRFNREWIFRDINFHFASNAAYAILGPNGSGKSTLLQVLSGSMAPSAGTISFTIDDKEIDAEKIYQQLSIAAPYLELIEEYTLLEMIDFHFKFKTPKNGLDRGAIVELLNLQSSRNKAIRYFSSGMKQRVKLALAFCSDTRLLVLDEPTSNLDEQGVEWYLSLVEKYAAGRLTLVGSNQPHEYGFCTNQLNISDYKTAASKAR